MRYFTFAILMVLVAATATAATLAPPAWGVTASFSDASTASAAFSAWSLPAQPSYTVMIPTGNAVSPFLIMLKLSPSFSWGGAPSGYLVTVTPTLNDGVSLLGHINAAHKGLVTLPTGEALVWYDSNFTLQGHTRAVGH